MKAAWTPGTPAAPLEDVVWRQLTGDEARAAGGDAASTLAAYLSESAGQPESGGERDSCQPKFVTETATRRECLRNLLMLRGLDSERSYADPRALQELQAAALDRLKKFEFNLRRRLDAGNESLALSGSDEVPTGFRQAIEEYYRSLARKQ